MPELEAEEANNGFKEQKKKKLNNSDEDARTSRKHTTCAVTCMDVETQPTKELTPAVTRNCCSPVSVEEIEVEFAAMAEDAEHPSRQANSEIPSSKLSPIVLTVDMKLIEQNHEYGSIIKRKYHCRNTGSRTS
jgi:hypothetical protein